MNDQGQTIRDRLHALRLMAPKRDGLQLYRDADDKKRATRAATLYVYIRSDDNTYALHDTFFRRKRAWTPVEWNDFFRNRVLKGTGSNDDEPVVREGIFRAAILSGVNTRTQKNWSVRAVIGYITHDIRQSVRPTLVQGRHKTKSPRVKNGQNHLRRRHRNRARKAK